MLIKTWSRAFIAAILVQAFLSVPIRAQTVTVDAALLQQLQNLIKEQSEQLKQQSEQLGSQAQTIETLNSRVNQLERASTETQNIATEAQNTATAAQSTAAAAQTTATAAQTTAAKAIDTAGQTSAGESPDNVVTSGNDKIKVSVSGQINRAVNFTDDGEETRAYFVDNDVSNSRVRWVGEGTTMDGTNLGSRIEFGISPNNSGDVSQENETSDDFLDVRKAEGFVRNDTYGMLQFGKGQAAADDTAEYDLSLVGAVNTYSGVADLFGAIQFTESSELTGIRVDDVFFNFDGNRQNRVAIDSPIIGPGLQIAASAGDDQRYDIALKWGYDYGDWSGVKIGDFLTLGAISIRDPSRNDTDWRLAGSFSAIHEPTGLGLTVSGGMDKRDKRDNPHNLYAKLSWDTTFFDFGDTGFGIDYTYGKNRQADSDDNQSYGLGFVQLIDDWSTELYAQYRVFAYQREDEQNPDNIVAGTIGGRIKF